MGNRYAYIDSARAIAALLVVWQHSAELFVQLTPAASNAWMAQVADTVDFGRLGVIVFFAISGFVIPASLEPADPGAGRKFVIRRIFRLFPAYWLSIPAAIIGVWGVLGMSMSPRDVVLNFTMIPELLGAKPALGLYWTLAYELGFYALCLGLWRLGVLGRAWIMLVLLLAATGLGGALILGSVYLQRPELGAAAMNVLCFGAMFAGTCWRRLLEGGYDIPQKAALALGLAGWLVALPAGCAAILAISGQATEFFVRVPASYGGGLLVFLLLTTVAKIEWRPLAWVGLVSYSLYLFHPMALYPLFKLAEAAALTRIDVALATLATAALSVVLAAAVFYLVERPAIAMGRGLTARAAEPATAVA
jgi:peptidoglycan/LPS O-acetylase OafA/YrhL